MLPTKAKLSLFIIITVANSIFYSANGLRILGLFPFQAKSHFVAGKELMKSLAEKGHQVDVYSHFPLSKPIPNYTDFSLDGSLRPFQNSLTHANVFTFSTSLFKMMFNRYKVSIKDMCKLLEHPHFQNLLHHTPRDPPYDLVILEISTTNCFAYWGRYLKVPIIGMISLSTMDPMDSSVANPINLAVNSGVLSRYAWPMTFFERLCNTLTYHTTVLLYDIFMWEHNEYVRKIFGPDVPSMQYILQDLSLVLTNQNIANAIKPLNPSMVPIPGLHIIDRNDTLPKDIEEWLDNSVHGCVYFSFGSMVRIETFPKDKLQAFYKGFRNIAPVRVLMKIVKPEELPDDIPSNVMFKAWFPQIQILKHKNIKAFITHGGLMGTQESIYYGIPMLGIPLFADQLSNIDAYVKKNIAVRLYVDEINEETFPNTLNEVLKNPVYKESIEKLSITFKDRPMSPKDTAIFWTEYISRHGKDALRSPLIDMPTYQTMLLDVYGFIVMIIILISYVTVKLFKKFVSVFCYASCQSSKTISKLEKCKKS